MKQPAGFTLIEVLVALMVFLVGVTGILALMTTGLAMHRDGLGLAAAARRIDDLCDRAARLAAEGALTDPVSGELLGRGPELLPDGLWWELRPHPLRGGRALLLEVRVGGSRQAAVTAAPVFVVVPEAPPAAQTAARLATRLSARPP